MPQFRTCEKNELSHLPLAPHESLIGVYEDTPGSLERAVVVTTDSVLLLRDLEPLRVRFGDIEDVGWSPEAKREANSLRVTLRDGSVARIPITGKHGGGSDVFEFLRFVSRCIAVARDADPALERQ